MEATTIRMAITTIGTETQMDPLILPRMVTDTTRRQVETMGGT